MARRDEFTPKIVYRRRPGEPASPALAPRRSAPGWSNGPVAARRGGLAGRLTGLRWLVAADVGILIGLLFAGSWLYQARVYEIERSFDVAEELGAALTGLNLMMLALGVAAAGFAASLWGLLTRRRVGWTVALCWAVAMTLTGVGALYGLPATVYLAARSTRRRFGRVGVAR